MTPPRDLRLRAFLPDAVPWLVVASAVGVTTSLLTAALALLVTAALRDPFGLPVGWLLAVLAGLALTAALGPPARARATHVVRRRARHMIFRHLVDAGPAVRDSRRTGDLAGIITDGVERVGAMVGRFFPLVVRGIVVPIAVAILAMTIDVWVGLAMLVAFPAVPMVLRHLERSFRDAGERLRRSRDALSADFLDALQGLTTLKLFGRASDWSEELAARAEEVRRDTMSVLRVNQRALIWVDLVHSLVSVVMVVAVVTWRASTGAIGVSEGVGLFLLAVVAVGPLVDVVSFFYLGALGLGALRRIAEVAELPRRPAGAARPDTAALGRLEFQDVFFRYEGATGPALDRVDMVVEAGTKVALIGRSGAGKSTLSSLAVGFRHPQRGCVLVDGVDLREAAPGWLNERISYVGQSTHLFNSTVAENLRVARPDASPEQLAEACRQANVLDTVSRLPEGFETVVGERGRHLSGGEAQRIGIARALLADTPILILDEATSSLDLETEALVTEAVERLMEGRTVLVIAHRITTVRRCSRVIQLESGRLVMDARPDQIDEGLFRRMQESRR